LLSAVRLSPSSRYLAVTYSLLVHSLSVTLVRACVYACVCVCVCVGCGDGLAAVEDKVAGAHPEACAVLGRQQQRLRGLLVKKRPQRLQKPPPPPHTHTHTTYV
jgi:hypothetical protein